MQVTEMLVFNDPNVGSVSVTGFCLFSSLSTAYTNYHENTDQNELMSVFSLP